MEPGFLDSVIRAVNELRWGLNDQRSRHELEAGRVVLQARPQFLIIDPTSRCDARCVMCPVSFREPSNRGRDLPEVLFDKIRPIIHAASHINLFATGEPTLAKHLPRFIDETLRQAGPGAQIWISTHGKRLTPEVLEALEDPRVGLQFSVDGGSKEVFEAIRRGIKFDQLCRSLALVDALRGDRAYPALSFSCTISKSNLGDLSNIFALAKKHRVDRVLFYEEDPESPDREQFLLDEGDRTRFEAQLPFINSTRVAYFSGLTFRGPAPRSSASKPEFPKRPLRCLAPWKVFYLRAEGDVRTCCTLRTSMGNLNEVPFDEVWNGQHYQGLRRALVEQSGIPEACFSCTDPLRHVGSPPWSEGDP
jgi:MoaA/NifB/PqqE/SkfB family radical SAM enzyme